MKIIKYIQNSDKKFYEDIEENLSKIDIKLEEIKLSKYHFVPYFIKKYLQDKELSKIKDIKISSKPLQKLDIFIHKGKLDNDNIKAIKTAKQVIVNSLTQKALIENKLGKVSNLNIIYPYMEVKKKDKKTLKQEIFKDINISNPNEHIILFHAKNFKLSGIKEFMQIISNLTQRNFVAFIVGTKEEINKNKFVVDSFQTQSQHIYFIDIKTKAYSIDDLFNIADIYLLPTKRTLFSANILKAMAYKTVVMVPAINGASEIVDAFSIMDSPTDLSVSFKLDALLQREKDLKLIKKTNKKISKEFTKKRYIESFIQIVDSFFLK